MNVSGATVGSTPSLPHGRRRRTHVLHEKAGTSQEQSVVQMPNKERRFILCDDNHAGGRYVFGYSKTPCFAYTTYSCCYSPLFRLSLGIVPVEELVLDNSRCRAQGRLSRGGTFPDRERETKCRNFLLRILDRTASIQCTRGACAVVRCCSFLVMLSKPR